MADDPGSRAQNPAELLGKALRLDVETGRPYTYTVPPSNPFVGRAGQRPEIWASGLRNPWRFSFDRATGDLFIGDVGQNNFEAINFQPASSRGGENYGWRILEGRECFNPNPCVVAGLAMPVRVYTHAEGCSVTGGYVYRVHKTAFGDLPGRPVPVRREVFLPDTQAVGRDVVVGVGQWQAALEANKRAYLEEFVTREAFVELYPTGQTPAAYVDALNRNAGNPLSPAERDDPAARLSDGRETRATRRARRKPFFSVSPVKPPCLCGEMIPR